MEATKIALFKGKKIRKTLFQNEWCFSVIDVIEALTDSNQPSKYWTAMKARVNSDDGFQLSTICRQLKLESAIKKDFGCYSNLTQEAHKLEKKIQEDWEIII